MAQLSLYHAILTYQDLEPGEFFRRLDELAPGLFKPIKDKWGDGTGRIIMTYLAYAYSEKSDLLILDARYGAEKKKIAELVQLPEFLYGAIVLMSSKTFKDVVYDYLEYQQDRDWHELVAERETYELLMDSQSRSRNEDGTIDFKQLTDIGKARAEQRRQVKELEDNFKKRYAFVAENQADINKLRDSSAKRGAGVENSPFIK